MATAFAAQLQKIAATSSHELDLRARKTAHSESLLFPPEIAAKQDFETIYAVCIDGFRELCQLDIRLREFEKNLFSAQSVRQEREQMTQGENEALDHVLERCLELLASKVLLRPGWKAVEWLVRRFKVHVHNVSTLLLTFLPYHEMQVWKSVVAIIQTDKFVGEWKFLRPYCAGSGKEKTVSNAPRHAIIYTATNNDAFFTALNRYVIEVCREGAGYAALIKFWAGVTMDAVVGRLTQARSGRKEIQRQRTEDALLKILPVLSDGLEIHDCPELTTACLTLAMIVAAKAELDEKVLDSLLLTVARSTRSQNVDPSSTVTAIALIVSRKQVKSMPKAGVELFMETPEFGAVLQSLAGVPSTSALIESLVNGTVSHMKRKTLTKNLPFLENLLRLGSSQSAEVTPSLYFRPVLAKIQSLDPSNHKSAVVRSGLIELLQKLNEEKSISLIISDAGREMGYNSEQIEAWIGATIAQIEPLAEPSMDLMEIDQPESPDHEVEDLLSRVPVQSDYTSFLSDAFRAQLFEQLAGCFVTCCRSKAALHRFSTLPIWSHSDASQPLYVTFLARVAIGSPTPQQKATATRLLSQLIQSLENIDWHDLLPYALTTLADPSQAVRRMAAELIVALGKAEITERTAGVPTPPNGYSSLWSNNSTEKETTISPKHASDIVRQAILPSLEEMVLDSSRVSKTVQSALNSSDETRKTSNSYLKKDARHSLFDLLTSHARITPLLAVKISIINLLDNVHKVGASSKSKSLMPLLQQWAARDENSARTAADSEHLSLNEIDATMTRLIVAQDKDAVGSALRLVEDHLQGGLRSAFITAVFTRIQRIWKDLKYETQSSAAYKMFELAFSRNTVLSREAQNVLSSVDLSTNILGSLLEQMTSSIASVQSDNQPKKRRRTSHGHDSAPPDMASTINTLVSTLTYTLELVDGSEPETRPELVPPLFDILAALKPLKQQNLISSPYVVNLCLSSILAILEKQRSLSRITVDIASIRADLVTDCIRTFENPSVQNTALMLSAALASLSPERVLHNVMPIFTFVGSKMLSKEDDHSIYVINQAIDQIIPALVQSLRRQKQDLVKSTSGLLSSFTAAFDHIPRHRRVTTYQRLLSRMGVDDFAYIVISMLGARKLDQQVLTLFFSELLAEFSAQTQLVTYEKLVALMQDLISPQPKLGEEIFGFNKSTTLEEVQNTATLVFNMALQVLRSRSLKNQVAKIHKQTPEVADSIRHHLNISLRQVLSVIRHARQNNLDIVDEGKQCLDALLELPTLVELFRIVPSMLDEMNSDVDLKPQVLRIVAGQLLKNASKDSKTRIAATEFMSTLVSMLGTEGSAAMKQAIIVCTDRVSEIYGRKDIEVVLSAASVISSENCLGSGERRVKIVSVLCLASMLEILKEACVPIVPQMTVEIIRILGDITQESSTDEELHNAAYTLIGAIAFHIPFLVTDDDLRAILVLSASSAVKYTSPVAIESRSEALSTIAKQVEFMTVLESSSHEYLDKAREAPESAEIEKLDFVSAAIEAATKANVIKNAELVSRILLAHLDQRRRFHSDPSEQLIDAIKRVEDKVNEVSVQFIYKLNDTSFRPIFESWIDWATNMYDIPGDERDAAARTLRQTSLFKLLIHFFNTLKSIVTSYSSYLTQPASTVLKIISDQFSSKVFSNKWSSEDQNLYITLLTLLRTMFTHDADAFFTNPSHFDPLGPSLISQLQLGQSKPHRTIIPNHIIPTIVALATATVDSPAHHQTLSHHLTELRRSDSAAVRLASIQTIAALTNDEELGEDWIGNTIGVGSGGTNTEGEGVGITGRGSTGGSAGEIMIYVNEMLEDDDEDVEREVRKWVYNVREKVGEDVFEM